MRQERKKIETIKKQLTFQKEIYTGYIELYMKKRKLRSVSMAIEQAFLELMSDNK
jgi:hypothetical protein